MWDLADIKNKTKEISKKLKTCKDSEEKDLLELTLAIYLSILINSGSIRYTKFYNFLDIITGGKYTLISKKGKMIRNFSKILEKKKNFMDISYLQFLMQLAENVANTKKVIKNDNELVHQSLELSDELLINISRLFYLELGDEEIFELAKKLLDDDTVLNFSDEFYSCYQNCMGLNFSDFIYNKSYCAVKRNYTIYDVKSLNHEVMHGIDFYMGYKIPTKNYYGFIEVPTYTIDYMFIDYLEKFSFNKDDIQRLRLEKDYYLQCLSDIVLFNILESLVVKNGSKILLYYSAKEVIEIITPGMVRQLLEIESGVIAYGLYKEIKENKEEGLSNLKKFMKTYIPKDKKPDFSYLGLSDEKLLELSKEIGSYSKEHEPGNKRIVKKISYR